jgi:hypothetical protein
MCLYHNGPNRKVEKIRDLKDSIESEFDDLDIHPLDAMDKQVIADNIETLQKELHILHSRLTKG